jgi:hypothetical protein
VLAASGVARVLAEQLMELLVVQAVSVTLLKP